MIRSGTEEFLTFKVDEKEKGFKFVMKMKPYG